MNARTDGRPRWRRRALWLGAAVVVAGAAALAWAEHAGWPFLAHPVERYAGKKLERSLVLSRDPGEFQLKLFGGIRLDLARLEIGNPAWSTLGPMLQAEQIHLHLRWRDLLAARDGKPLALQELRAHQIDLQLERQAEGRASWDFGHEASAGAADAPAIRGVHVGRVGLDEGTLLLRDAVQALAMDGRVKANTAAAGGWVGQATGRWRGQPLKAEASAGQTLTEQLQGDRGVDVPVKLNLVAGRSRLDFDGFLQDPMGSPRTRGKLFVAGPSLAAVGEPFGLTLPTTAPFSLRGTLQHEGTRWQAAVAQARIGRSELAGDFVFENPAGTVPRLSGELRGKALWLQDLGPAIGTAAATPAPAASGAGAAPAAKVATASGMPPKPATPAASAASAAATRTAGPGRVLPDRRFDLPALSAMQADVRIALDRFELGHERLQAIQPLRAHLKLQDGVLLIDAIDARAARGRIGGHVRLDGRKPPARWDVDLSARGLVLEEWIAQPRRDGQPPYLAGRLAGRVQLKGEGNSTAQLLGSSDGQIWAVMSQGRISHLAMEAAGLDVAQAIGVLLRGDRGLQVSCGATDLQVKDGMVRPRMLVVDTTDSTLWAEGALSLATERLDLVARVEPKDFSPLALRSPLRVRGTLGAPQVSIDKQALARRLVPAAALALVHPLAALLPLLDSGDDDAQAAVGACQALLAQR